MTALYFRMLEKQMINLYVIYVEIYSAQNYEIKVQIFSGYLKEVYSNLNILEKNYCTFVHF